MLSCFSYFVLYNPFCYVTSVIFFISDIEKMLKTFTLLTKRSPVLIGFVMPQSQWEGHSLEIDLRVLSIEMDLAERNFI